MRFGSLFAGIGGMDLGLERAGMQCAWQVEIDDYATRILAKHWPTVSRFGDVRECGSHNLESVDLICGGFPCQDISTAGKGAGIDGARSGLWSEYARIVCELRPRYVVVENVSALSYRGIERVLGDLAFLGFDAEWDTIPACVFGAAHTRKRMFIVAYASGERCHAVETEAGIFTEKFTKRTPADGTQTIERVGDSYAIPLRHLRVADGISSAMDEVRCLGNAVVPQVAQWIGERIMAHDLLLTA